jgi:dethiobiotin synthetase
VLNSELAVVVNLPIVIVVKDELGAINQALLSIEAAKKHKLNKQFIRVKMVKACFLKTKPSPLTQTQTNLKKPI